MRHTIKSRSILSAVVALLAYAVLSAGCASSGKLSQAAAAPESRPGAQAGYLPSAGRPNILVLIPPPPAADSAALAADEEVSRKALALRGTPRWKLATEDADLTFPQAAGTFSCAVNAPITEHETPHIYALMRRASVDAGLSTSAAKEYYRRPRPFMVNKEPTCTPAEEDSLAKSGSYPSGHTAVGWAWALILTEIAPERADAILARGRAFGMSRVVCNVHWQSDVTDGRFIAAGLVARLHADAAFRADLEAAKLEFASVRAKGLKPQRDCAAEDAAMGGW